MYPFRNYLFGSRQKLEAQHKELFNNHQELERWHKELFKSHQYLELPTETWKRNSEGSIKREAANSR
jgi:hypothetical protein